MDILVALVNKIRGKDLNAPLLDPKVPPVTPVFTMTADQKAIERKRLLVLEPSTQEFVKSILTWARANGIPAILGETYRSREDELKIPASRSAIAPGNLSWHSVGRAFHLIIKDGRGNLDKAAYALVGDEVRKRGGVWLGDHVIKGPGGNFVDLAHYEYHPGLILWQYRKSQQAAKELALAEKRATKYG
jgi:hypothetical protein